MIKSKIKKNKAGFVILFAVTLAAILLSIALGVANIALTEIKFGTSARDTNNAFFAADSGIEKALFNDNTVDFYPAGSSTNFIVSSLGSTGVSCANVTVDKTDPPTVTIIAKGYNIGSQDGLCTSTNPNRVERELKTTY
jgi:Tfp pilus assembly protein PilX